MFEFDFDGVKNCSVIAALPTNKDKSILSKTKYTQIPAFAATKSMFSLQQKQQITIKELCHLRELTLRS